VWASSMKPRGLDAGPGLHGSSPQIAVMLPPLLMLVLIFMARPLRSP
jgi:hypothetical protein